MFIYNNNPFIYKIKLIFILVLVFLIFSCDTLNEEQAIKVAVASNLRFAMEELNKEYEKQTGRNVEMITASSGKLTAQITNGAPFDIFISANKKYSQKLYKNGFSYKKPKIICKGILVLWSNSAIETDLINMSQNPDLKTIAIANPNVAPYGIAAIELLKSANLYDTLESKLIFAENVLQINQYIINKVAQVGFTSKSLVLSDKLKHIGVWTEIDKSKYSPIEHFVMILNDKSKSANAYYEFLFSPKSKEILKKYGYLID